MSGAEGRSGGSMRETGKSPTDDPGHASQPGYRREVGSAADSQRHPPHVTTNDVDAPVQADMQSPHPAPALPANAHGEDKGELTDQPPIQPESMYENRPGENKDTPPSTTGGQ